MVRYEQQESIGSKAIADEADKLAWKIYEGNKFNNKTSVSKAIELKNLLDQESYATSKALQRGEKVSGSTEIYQKAANLLRDAIHKTSPEIAKLDAQVSSYFKIVPDLKKMNIAEKLAQQTASNKTKSLQAQLLEAIQKEKLSGQKARRNIISGSIIGTILSGGLGYGIYKLLKR